MAPPRPPARGCGCSPGWLQRPWRSWSAYLLCCLSRRPPAREAREPAPPGRWRLEEHCGSFGKPGIPPTWTSSAKDLVITALGQSRLWATRGHGILNEVYWPATGQPQIRDLGFIVGGDDFWVEVKRANQYWLSIPEPYMPLPQVIHKSDRYRLTLEFLPDPSRDLLLIRYRNGHGRRWLALYPLLAPHLGMSGWNNTGWVDHGLLAASDGRALCLLAAPPFVRVSAGYVGYSDGWQDFARNGHMTYAFDRAADGNIALMGELDSPQGVLALGLAQTPEGARTLAASSLAEGYDPIRDRFVLGWREWGGRLDCRRRRPSSPRRPAARRWSSRSTRTGAIRER